MQHRLTYTAPMIAVNIQTSRSNILALFEMLDKMDRHWRFYNVYDDAPTDANRHQRIRLANEGFIRESMENGSGDYSAEITICTTPDAAMLLRLSYAETTVTDLRKTEDNSNPIT